MEKAIILLATYNGEKYIGEQLDSLLAQTYQNIKIIIRDDGSSDNTKNILKEYKKNFYEKIDIIFEKNIGVIKSFFRLIELSEESDYYFFCDQDDFWEKEKISEAIKKIKQKEKSEDCIGYCTDLKLVNENLEYLGMCYNSKMIPSLNNCFFENIVAGCTYACNKNLFLKIKEGIKKIDVSKIIMHDYYFYFITLIYGKLIVDNNSYILYRQHSNNTIGGKNGILNKIKNRIKKFSKSKNKKCIMFKMLLKHYQEHIGEEKIIIEGYNSFFIRVKNIMTFKIKRQKLLDTFIMNLLYLIKCY